MPPFRNLPPIVEGSRLRTAVKEDLIVHKYTDRNNTSYREEKWKTEKRLGSGAYGTVWLQKCVEGRPEGTVRAVKHISGNEITNKRIDWIRELETIMEFSHQHSQDYFVKSFGWYGNPTKAQTFITMEYLEHGDLETYRTSHPAFVEDEIRDICFQLLGGIRFMHSKNFAHRDLKPANILIKAKPPERWWVKIGDFGLSKRIEATMGNSVMLGTMGYMAPELQEAGNFQDLSIDAKPADMWALGEILFRLVTKNPVFGTQREMWQYMDRLRNLPTEVLAEKCGPDGIEFYSSLMARAPADRPTADVAYSHHWLDPLRLISPIRVPTGFESMDNDDFDLHHLRMSISSTGSDSSEVFDLTTAVSGAWTTIGMSSNIQVAVDDDPIERTIRPAPQSSRSSVGNIQDHAERTLRPFEAEEAPNTTRMSTPTYLKGQAPPPPPKLPRHNGVMTPLGLKEIQSSLPNKVGDYPLAELPGSGTNSPSPSRGLQNSAFTLQGSDVFQAPNVPQYPAVSPMSAIPQVSENLVELDAEPKREQERFQPSTSGERKESISDGTPGAKIPVVPLISVDTSTGSKTPKSPAEGEAQPKKDVQTPNSSVSNGRKGSAGDKSSTELSLTNPFSSNKKSKGSKSKSKSPPSDAPPISSMTRFVNAMTLSSTRKHLRNSEIFMPQARSATKSKQLPKQTLLLTDSASNEGGGASDLTVPPLPPRPKSAPGLNEEEAPSNTSLQADREQARRNANYQIHLEAEIQYIVNRLKVLEENPEFIEVSPGKQENLADLLRQELRDSGNGHRIPKLRETSQETSHEA